MQDKQHTIEDFIQETRTLNGDIRRTIGRIQRVEDILSVHGMRYEGGSFTRASNDGTIPLHVVELVEYWEALQALLRHYRQDEERAVYIIEGIEEPHWRAALSLYALDGYTTSAIGRELCCSKDTARRWLDKGREVLADCLAEREDEFLQRSINY